MSGGAVRKDWLKGRKGHQILEISAGIGKKAGDAKMAPTVSSCMTHALRRSVCTDREVILSEGQARHDIVDI